MQNINNADFVIYLTDYAEAKEKNPKLKPPSLGASGKNQVTFDTLLQEASNRTFTMGQKISVAMSIKKLGEMEDPSKLSKVVEKGKSWFAKTFKKEPAQTQKKRVAELVENLTRSAESEAATSIQKGFRRYRKAKQVIEKASIEYKTYKKAPARTTLIQRIVNFFRSLFRAVFGTKQPAKIMPRAQTSTDQAVCHSSPDICALKKDVIEKLNKEYLSIFDSLGQKQGCPIIVSSDLQGETLTISHDKSSQLTFEYFGTKGSLAISQEVQMQFKRSDTEASIAFANPVPVKVKFPFFGECSYELNKLVLESNKVTLTLKIGNDEKVVPLDIDKIKSAANKLNWAAAKS